MMIQNATTLSAISKRIRLLTVSLERERGTTWEEIGRQLGTTRSSAHSTYAYRLELNPAPELFELWATLGELARQAAADIFHEPQTVP